jgi:uncharacterized RDD family membrane protein YckC
VAQIRTASFGRRLIAIVIDWSIASVISIGLFRNDAIATMCIYALMQILLVGTLSFSIGHRVCSLAVVSLDGRSVGLWRALIRTCLILLVIPAFIWDTKDGRGLQDKAVGTAIIKL